MPKRKKKAMTTPRMCHRSLRASNEPNTCVSDA
jgi:hypothetical protein